MSATPVIEVSHLSRSYGDHLAVDDISFSVPEGEIVGFLGPNGAGKSTTLRMLTGFLAPTSGTIRVAGSDVQLDPISVRQELGYMPETCPLYPELRVAEYLEFRARLKGVTRRQLNEAVDRAMRQAGIHQRRGSLIGQLSKGLRQRVGLADALVALPKLLILDEPTAGLDPNQIREVRSLIRGLKQQHTVLLSTHILQEVEMVCDRVIVLSQGRIVGAGTLEELRRTSRQPQAELVFEAADDALPDLKRAIEPHAIALETRMRDGLTTWLVELKRPELALAPLIAALSQHKIAVHEARLLRTRLEDVFAELTRGGTNHG